MQNKFTQMKTISTFLLILLSAISINAQRPLAPQIPTNIFNVAAFGAVGDGKNVNTTAIQTALDKTAEKGGVLIIPKGVFRCGPIEIKSRTHLVLEKGAVLKLINDVESYPVADGRYLNFITIKKVNDVKISGEGIIDGQGEIWWDKFTAKEITFRRPQLLIFERCERVEIAGITTLNPPNTHISLKACKEVYIHDINISAPEKSRNTDGINISAKNTLIERCKIATGDDNIAINFGDKKPNVEPEVLNMVIRDCAFGYGHGLSIGSYTSGGLKNLHVNNCTFNGTTSAIRIKTARGRGGVLDNIVYENIDIKNVKWPIFISMYYPKEPKYISEEVVEPFAQATPVYKNIKLINVNATNAEVAIKMWGLPESVIENISMTNVNIDAGKGAELYNVKNLIFEKSTINVSTGEKIKIHNTTYTGLK
jgi:polygalacturonase